MTILISKCLNQRKTGDYHFHYKGVYKGFKINSVVVKGDGPMDVGREYVIFLQVLHIQKGCLVGQIKKYKPVDSFEVAPS